MAQQKMLLVTPLFIWKVLRDIYQQHVAEGNSVLRTLEKMQSPNQRGLLYGRVCPPTSCTRTPQIGDTEEEPEICCLLHGPTSTLNSASYHRMHGSDSCFAGVATEKLESCCSSVHDNITLLLMPLSSFLQQKGRAGYLIHTASGSQCRHLSVCACNPSTSKTDYKNQFQILFGAFHSSIYS